jgi:hypothetical protein
MTTYRRRCSAPCLRLQWYEVVVLNADDYSVVGKVEGMTRSHGIAIVKELARDSSRTD